MIKINTSGDYVQLIYVDPVQESVQQELKSDTDAFECSYDSDGKLYLQFGEMTFENPDPTSFTINGVAVTDAADFITKINALFTGGGGGGWGTSGMIATLTGDGTVDLNDHSIQFGNGNLFIYDEEQYFNAKNSTGGGNLTAIIATTSDDAAGFTLSVDFNDGEKQGNINGSASSGVCAFAYTADTHTFNGINEFVDDAAAAAGGVPVNGLYHSMGTVKIRLS